MRRRLFNTVTLTGIGSWLLAVLPFVEEEDMSITTWALIGIGTVLFFWGILKKPAKDRLKRTDVNALYDARVRYLPQLQESFENYIGEVELLVKSKSKLQDIKTYDKYNPSFMFPLFFIFNNVVFRQILEDDKELFRIKQQMDTYGSRARDRRVVKFKEGLPRACYLAYSYVIYTQLCRKKYGESVPFGVQIWFFLGDKMQARFRRHLTKINTTIQDLLEVVDDEV